MQNRDRFPLQTFGNVLDSPGSQRDPRAALLPAQRPLWGLLGGPPGSYRRITPISMSRTRRDPSVEARFVYHAMWPRFFFSSLGRASPVAKSIRVLSSK